ncbi:acyl-CoA-binding domain-containing protein 4 isoform X6 [Carassius carassius]|uniref:acyl-CoA-binding domain-containing protein 4 isoform X6 n=1 Tax=Carassius carassius TaxID=217509 RepID=UPI0028686E3D|nr:acyl-CoA-binding domain-containing protein 4 isoform X6 [Carassius carassius]
MSEIEDCLRRFQAAVDVIQSLPKNGSYRPSYEVMLRFYGLYKQAVCGPCTASRPGFWDPVGRYKWDAWNRFGDMSRESAMSAYVDEIKKVAQEMEMPESQLMVGVIMKWRGQLKNQLFNRSTQRWFLKVNFNLIVQVIQIGAGHGGEGAEDRHGPPIRRRTTGREGMQQGWRNPSGYMAGWAERLSSGAGSGQGGRDDSEGGPDGLLNSQVQQQIILAVWQLREDMQSVMERLEVVEGLATANAQRSHRRSYLQMTAAETEEKWWPFDISRRTLLLLLVWPFVTQALLFLLRRRKIKD